MSRMVIMELGPILKPTTEKSMENTPGRLEAGTQRCLNTGETEMF